MGILTIIGFALAYLVWSGITDAQRKAACAEAIEEALEERGITKR